MAADDGAVGPQGSAFLDEGGADLVLLGDFRAGVLDVPKDAGGAAEDAILQDNAFIHADPVPNGAHISRDQHPVCLVPH